VQPAARVDPVIHGLLGAAPVGSRMSLVGAEFGVGAAVATLQFVGLINRADRAGAGRALGSLRATTGHPSG